MQLSCWFYCTENLVTPEESTLLDNATGSTNYAAKGAHRLQIILDFIKIEVSPQMIILLNCYD